MYVLLSYVLTLSQMFPQMFKPTNPQICWELMMLWLSRRESESTGRGEKKNMEKQWNEKEEENYYRAQRRMKQNQEH